MTPPTRSAVAALLVALGGACASAQPVTSVRELTAVERKKDDFYGAIAGRVPVTARWSVEPAAVDLGAPATLTLTVGGAVNPHELERPPLATLDEFTALFAAIEDEPESPPASGAAFRYRVRPRTTGTFRVPELAYRYYQPGPAGGGRFQLIAAEAVPFTVSEPPPKAVAIVPLDAPPSLLRLRVEPTGPFAGEPRAWMWATLFGGSAALAAVWVVGWRLLFPDAARLAVIRRRRSVRTALDRLTAAARSPDPAGATAVVVRNYLAARFGMASSAQTPNEVADALLVLDLPADRVAEAESLLRACDSTRFAPGVEAKQSFPRSAARMIERWEGATA